jgi:hypothetical protein
MVESIQLGWSSLISSSQVIELTVASRLAGPSGGTGSSSSNTRLSPSASDTASASWTGTLVVFSSVIVDVWNRPPARGWVCSYCHRSVPISFATSARALTAWWAVSWTRPTARRPGNSPSVSSSTIHSMP